MAREDIIGGLKSALTRGFSLKDAMISFYNAGYKKEDIEDAARKLQYEIMENQELKDLIMQANSKALGPGGVSLPTKPTAPTKPGTTPGTLKEPSRVEVVETKKPSPGGEIEVPPISGKEVEKPEEHEEKTSKGFSALPLSGAMHRTPPSKMASQYQAGTGIRVLTIVLIVLLVLLLGALAAIFIFKNQIINFFNSLLA